MKMNTGRATTVTQLLLRNLHDQRLVIERYNACTPIQQKGAPKYFATIALASAEKSRARLNELDPMLLSAAIEATAVKYPIIIDYKSHPLGIQVFLNGGGSIIIGRSNVASTHSRLMNTITDPYQLHLVDGYTGLIVNSSNIDCIFSLLRRVNLDAALPINQRAIEVDIDTPVVLEGTTVHTAAINSLKASIHQWTYMYAPLVKESYILTKMRAYEEAKSGFEQITDPNSQGVYCFLCDYAGHTSITDLHNRCVGGEYCTGCPMYNRWPTTDGGLCETCTDPTSLIKSAIKKWEGDKSPSLLAVIESMADQMHHLESLTDD